MKQFFNKTSALSMVAIFAVLPIAAMAQSTSSYATDVDSPKETAKIHELQEQIKELNKRLDKLENEKIAKGSQIKPNSINTNAAKPSITKTNAIKPNAEIKTKTEIKPKVEVKANTPAITKGENITKPDLANHNPAINKANTKPDWSNNSTNTAKPNDYSASPDVTVPKTSAGLFQSAMVDNQNGEYAGAERKLNELVTSFPNAPEKLEAYWFLGETRYVQKKWSPAAQAYVKYLQLAPKGPKSSDSLVRVAATYRELGDSAQRCLALKEYKKRAANGTISPVLKARANAEIAKGLCPN